MCGIAVIFRGDEDLGFDVLQACNTRGRDGYGVLVDGVLVKIPGTAFGASLPPAFGCAILNFRAEPTTERVENPTRFDQQPYQVGSWTIVHNGTIANDKELNMAIERSPPTSVDSWIIAGLLDHFSSRGHAPKDAFALATDMLEGSFAILAKHKSGSYVYYAVNHRPLYQHRRENGYAVLSVRLSPADVLIPPYTRGMLGSSGIMFSHEAFRLPEGVARPKTLVVLSGGLDSTVVASMLVAQGHAVEALHFDYGCRATGREFIAVEAICHHLDIPLRVVKTDLFRTIGNSRLIDGGEIDNGVAGAELAIEWVPARNTIMASIAIGIAEANGFDHIALGINLEEAGGSYTDNVIDLYDGLNGLMQWIIGAGRRLRFISPLGNMMKHEIVSEGLAVGAPMHLSWSCYNHGVKHCGQCGPCFMRKRAFEMNNSVDPVFSCDTP